MTSKPQLTANRTNARKSTGPKSKAGKSIASTNAVKHGGTAKRLISSAESQAYQAFLAALQKAYPSKNPLVTMQLERIAKIKIHLERIQTTIDATFEMARKEENIDTGLMDLLNMDKIQKDQAKSIAFGEIELSEWVNHDRIKILAELSSVNVDELKTHHDFLTKTPQLCQYLFNRSCDYKISILNFINLYAEVDIKKSNQLNDRFEELMRALAHGIGFDSNDNLDNAIQKANVEALSKAAKLYALEINRLSDAHYKITAFTRLRQIPHLSIALNLDTLDKLFRYQSTLQRQLSSCIGELLVLNKPSS